jgi:hypothetical protein
MKHTVWFIAATLLVAGAAQAQVDLTRGGTITPELRPFVGAYVPTGTQSDLLKEGVVSGLQVGLEATRYMHVVGTFAWSSTHNRNVRLGTGPDDQTGSHRVNLYAYDAGVEFFTRRNAGSEWQLRPFVGAGVGGRTYDPVAHDAKTLNDMAGYGTLGTELQRRSIALRIEGRDYVSQWKGIDGNESSKARNDLMFVAALAWHLR